MPVADEPAVAPDGTELAFGLFEFFKLQREQLGIEYCKKTLVGPLRRKAGPALPTNTTPLNSPDMELRSKWALALERHCWACKGCKWALK